MTHNHDHPEVRRDARPLVRTPRLRLKAKAPLTGYVDGAWWPRSDALVTEIPDLLAVLSVRLGVIDRVLYNVDEWSTPPTKLVIGGQTVHFDGYRRQPPHSVEILGLNRSRITLLVVPPGTDPGDAHTTMMTAASPLNASTVNGLLRINLRDNEIQPQRTRSEQQRWETDGGSPKQPAFTGHSGESSRS